MKYLLDFRRDDIGGPVMSGRLVTSARPPGQLGKEADLFLEPKVTFLVHGYNVTRRNGTRTLLALADLLEQAGEEALVGVLWPGDHWTTVISYPFEGEDADDTALRFADYITRKLRPGAEISFVSHSLGARVVMGTINHLRGKGFRFAQVCLMAAAIDDHSLAATRTFRNAVMEVKRVAVLASRSDTVLKLAYPVGDFVEIFVFWEDIAALALGYRGPRQFHSEAIPTQVFPEQILDESKVTHGDYIFDPFATPAAQAKQRVAARFIAQVLQGAGSPTYG